MYCKSIKVAKRINIAEIRKHYKLENSVSWDYCVELPSFALERILKTQTTNKNVLMFDFGCMSFVNLNAEEINKIIDATKSFFNGYSKKAVKVYEDEYTFALNKDAKDYDNQYKTMLQILPLLLAKSVEFDRLENELDVLLDQDETIINALYKNTKRFKKKVFKSAMAKIVSFNYNLLNSSRILDKNDTFLNDSHKVLYLEIMNHLDLNYRYEVFICKLDHVLQLVQSYSTTRHSTTMRTFFVYEVILLSIFPLMYNETIVDFIKNAIYYLINLFYM